MDHKPLGPAPAFMPAREALQPVRQGREAAQAATCASGVMAPGAAPPSGTLERYPSLTEARRDVRGPWGEGERRGERAGRDPARVRSAGAKTWRCSQPTEWLG